MRPQDKNAHLSYFSTRTYVLGTQKNRLREIYIYIYIYSFVIFQGGGGGGADPLPPSGSSHGLVGINHG